MARNDDTVPNPHRGQDLHTTNVPHDPTQLPIFPCNIPCTSTFTQIIDADHFTIQQLAKRIRRLLSTPTPATLSAHDLTTHISQLKPLLLEAVWRLLRHDLSEDIVMRPAFACTLGSRGQQMADHDRQDHDEARKALVLVIAAVDDLAQMPVAPAATATPQASISLNDKLQDTVARVTATFDELSKHMALESGEFLPRFESAIDGATGRRLAREYASTLVVMPDVTVAVSSEGSSCAAGVDRRKRTPVFPGGVTEYVNADLARLRECYELVCRDAKSDGGKYMGDFVGKEIERLQIGKWLSWNERKTSRESSSAGTSDDGKVKL